MSIRRFATASAWISGGLLAGRLAGFVRESTVAATFGAGERADAAVLVLTVPDLLVNILAGGALSVALVPEFTRRAHADGRRLFLRASAIVALAFAAVAMVLAVVPGVLVSALAPGLPSAAIVDISAPMRWVLWSIPLTALAGVSTAYLQARGRFAVAALGTLIFNTVVIVGLFALVRQRGSLDLLALAIIAASLARWLSQLAALPGPDLSRSATGEVRPATDLAASLMARYGQALLAGGFLLLLPVVVRAIASCGDAGGIARINYATKLVELPLGACVTVLSVALFPRLSEHFGADARSPAAATLLREGVLAVLALALAATVATTWFSAELARLAFGWGGMGDDAIAAVGALAAIGFLSLPAQGVSSLVVAAFNAKRDVATPMWINLLALPALAGVGWIASGRWGLVGLMAALTGTYWLVAITQVAALQIRHGIALAPTLCGLPAARLLVACVLGFAPVAALCLVWHPGRFAATALAGVGFLLANGACVLATPHWRSRALHPRLAKPSP